MTKTSFALGLFACLFWLPPRPAAATAPWPAVGALFAGRDWQGPQQLPPRFRNHCSFDTFSGRAYCSEHCGIDYQFYYCSRASFGCCHVGHGYCGWDRLLRCHP